MNGQSRTSRILGLAFLLQFITSFASGFWLKPAWLAPDDIDATLLKIADQPWLLRANILADMLTALGVIFLGAVLFLALRQQNEKLALTGLGFYILEAVLLASSKLATFSLLPISQQYVAAGRPENLQTLAAGAIEAMGFVGDTLHMLAFCVGATLFYYLLVRSRLVPRPLSLWGLVSILPLLFGTLAAIMDSELPPVLFLPYFPFELVIGLWILIKGAPESGPRSDGRGSEGLATV